MLEKRGNIVFLLFLIIFTISLTSANLGTFPPNSCVNIQIPSNCSSITLNSIISNNQTFNINSSISYSGGQIFNYSFCNTSTFGRYIYSWDDPCVDCSGGVCGNDFRVGFDITTTMITIYVLFLLVCLLLIFLSGRLVVNYAIEKDELTGIQKYQLKQRNNFLFYMTLFKKKLWILGLFGVYISLFLFSTILNQLLYQLGILEISNFLVNINYVLAWGLIPFTIFWIGYIIVFFYKAVENTLRYQYGGFIRENGKN